jgi:hypothetical protein
MIPILFDNMVELLTLLTFARNKLVPFSLLNVPSVRHSYLNCNVTQQVNLVFS